MKRQLNDSANLLRRPVESKGGSSRSQNHPNGGYSDPSLHAKIFSSKARVICYNLQVGRILYQ
jgi:hypothetical protein